MGRGRRPAAWYHAAALVELMASDAPGAARLLEEGASLHPRSGVLLNNLACALEQEGEMEGALRAVERGTREDTSLPQLHRNHGDLHLAAGRVEEAVASYERALRNDVPGSVDLRAAIASIRARARSDASATPVGAGVERVRDEPRHGRARRRSGPRLRCPPGEDRA